MSRGCADFSLETVVDSAGIIAEYSGESLLAKFQEDSLSDVSEARNDIWQDWDTFRDYAMSLGTPALTLAKVSSEAAFSDACRDMTRNCSGCHRDFRSK